MYSDIRGPDCSQREIMKKYAKNKKRRTYSSNITGYWWVGHKQRKRFYSSYYMQIFWFIGAVLNHQFCRTSVQDCFAECRKSRWKSKTGWERGLDREPREEVPYDILLSTVVVIDLRYHQLSQEPCAGKKVKIPILIDTVYLHPSKNIASIRKDLPAALQSLKKVHWVGEWQWSPQKSLHIAGCHRTVWCLSYQ